MQREIKAPGYIREKQRKSRGLYRCMQSQGGRVIRYVPRKKKKLRVRQSIQRRNERSPEVGNCDFTPVCAVCVCVCADVKTGWGNFARSYSYGCIGSRVKQGSALNPIWIISSSLSHFHSSGVCVLLTRVS